MLGKDEFLSYSRFSLEVDVATALKPDAPPAGLSGRRPGIGFWLVGYVFAITIAFSAVPAPLYVLYQARDHFGALLVTVIFAVYALGVAIRLFLVGPAVPGLIIGRIISGISIGMLTATATACLSELHTAARPGATRTRAEIMATAASLGGLGLGPLIAGFMAQYAGAPLIAPYLVFEALMLAGCAVLLVVPETVRPPERRHPYRPQRVMVPAASRGTFFAAGAATAVAFSLFGLFTSLAPGFLAGPLHDRSHALAGLATFIVFGAAALAQIGTSRISLRRQLGLGLSLLTAGLILVTVAVWNASLPLLLAGGALGGAGAGAVFKGGISTVLEIAPSRARSEALAGLFLAAYLGLAVPVIALGVATQAFSARTALLGFSVLLAAIIALVARKLLVRRPV